MLLLLLGSLIMLGTDLPVGPAPPPVKIAHFPDRLHAFIWRNWPLVPIARLAKTVGAKPEDILRIGKAMGLTGPPTIGRDQQTRSALTVIRRNWHLLPYDQHFDQYKADRHLPYPLPGDHFDAETAARTYEEHLAIWTEMGCITRLSLK